MAMAMAMAKRGAGAICIWNDIAAEGRDEFYDWHLNEHMPERAAIAGFTRSRRFIATDARTRPEFFTLYETRDGAVLTGSDYLARLNAPTIWTKRATQAFRNTSRALTTVLVEAGPGVGGVVATLRFAVPEGKEAAAAAALAEGVRRAARLPRVGRARLCRTDESASASRTAESRDRADILAAPSWVLLVEACDEAAARAAMAAAVEAAPDAFEGAPALGVYRFEYAC